MIDIKAIRAAAEAATPGPWEAVGPSFGEPLPKYLNEVGRINEDEMFEEVCVSPWPEDDACSADMIFIATANPTTIIALCDEIERLQQQLAIYEKHGVTCQTFSHKLTGCAECNRDDNAEIERLRKDAGRYQWLREQHNDDWTFAVIKNPHMDAYETREGLDDAIDAAMEASK